MSDTLEQQLLRDLLGGLREVQAEVHTAHREGAERGHESARRLDAVQAAGERICADLASLRSELGEVVRQQRALEARVQSLEADRRVLRLLSAGAIGLAGWLGIDRLLGWVRGHP